MSPCASVSQAPFAWERRRRFQRFHSDANGVYGQLTAGSSRSNDGWNRLILDTGIGANKMAESAEHFHQDWLAIGASVGQDKFWKLRQLVEGYCYPDTITLPAADSYISIGLGSPNSPPPFVYDENYFAVRRNLGANTWEAVINDPWMAGTVVVDLGPTGGGAAPAWAVGFAFKVRVEYFPRDRFNFWLNDKLVHVYNDADSMQAIYDNAGTASDEGGAYFVSTSAIGQQTKATFGPMYCETITT